MNCVSIDNPVSSMFSMVPNALWALDPETVSIDGKAIFAFLLSFRDGSTVRVALIEKALGIGRDKRRRAMKELEACGLISRVITRCRSGRVVTERLVVTTRPLLSGEAIVPDKPAATNPPESAVNQSPDIQAVGKHKGWISTPLGADINPTRGGKSGPLYNTKTKTKASNVNFYDLGPYQLSQLRSGNDVVLRSGLTVKAGTAAHAELLDCLE